MNKDRRNWFSQTDGTTISEDLKHFFDNLKNQIERLIDKFGHIAEILVNVMEDIDEAIKEGTPTDKIIDSVLSRIPGDTDEKIYKYVQENLGDWIDMMRDFLDWNDNEINDGDEDAVAGYQSLRHKSASIALESIIKEGGEEISRVETDTVIQNVVFGKA